MKALKKVLYIFFAVVSAFGYGYMMYYMFLAVIDAGGSLLDVYLSNAVNIIIMLLADKLTRWWLAKKCTVTQKNRWLVWFVYLDSVVSVKTALYIFYIFILIISQVSILEPQLIGEHFRDFVLSIQYSLVLLVAFDKLMSYIGKDMKHIKEISEKFKKYKAEKQEQADGR